MMKKWGQRMQANKFIEKILNQENGHVDKLIEIAGSGETEWLEFKGGLVPQNDSENIKDLRWHIARSVISIANSQGGALLIGIAEKEDKTLFPCGLPEDTPNIDVFDRKYVDPAVFPVNAIWETTKGEIWKLNEIGQLRNLVITRGGKYLNQDICILIIKPAPSDNLIYNDFQIKGKKEEYEVLFTRKPGAIGKVEKLTKRSSFDNYIENRTFKPEYFQNLYNNSLKNYEFSDLKKEITNDVKKYTKFLKEKKGKVTNKIPGLRAGFVKLMDSFKQVQENIKTPQNGRIINLAGDDLLEIPKAMETDIEDKINQIYSKQEFMLKLRSYLEERSSLLKPEVKIGMETQLLTDLKENQTLLTEFKTQKDTINELSVKTKQLLDNLSIAYMDKVPDLKILKALYGAGEDQDNWKDRTSFLNQKIIDKSLCIQVSNDELDCDPAYKKHKKLIVEYLFDGQRFNLSAGEGEILNIGANKALWLINHEGKYVCVKGVDGGLINIKEEEKGNYCYNDCLFMLINGKGENGNTIAIKSLKTGEFIKLAEDGYIWANSKEPQWFFIRENEHGKMCFYIKEDEKELFLNWHSHLFVDKFQEHEEINCVYVDNSNPLIEECQEEKSSKVIAKSNRGEGGYVISNPKGAVENGLYATGQNPGDSLQLEVSWIDKGMVVFTYEGKYLTLIHNGFTQLKLEQKELDEDCKFELVPIDNQEELFALKAANGKYVCADQHRTSSITGENTIPLCADRDEIDDWEMFQIQKLT